MQLIYKGADIMPDVSINKMLYDMYAEGRSDALQIRFNDPKKLWENWSVAIGDEIEFIDNQIKSGKMYIAEITPENGLYSIRALAMPPSLKTITNKAWQGVKFSKVVEEIAGRHGLSAELHGVSDVTYEYLVQDAMQDIAFLQHICELEGCALIIHNNKIVVYNESHIEGQNAQGELFVGIDGDYKYCDGTGFLYGSCKVGSGQYVGEYKANNDAAKIYIPPQAIRVNSEEEAKRYAKNLLRLVNKTACAGGIKNRGLTLDYAPASVVDLRTARAEAWNTKVFITHVQHDFVQCKTKIKFRKPLEGY